jgi:hypothetical protein
MQEVKIDQVGMGDIKPADKPTFTYGYGMPMMNLLLRKFHCVRREKIL